MKLTNAIFALAFAITMGLFLNSCEDTGTTGPEPTPTRTALKPITNLQANSAHNAINLKWDASKDTNISAMKGYDIYINGTKLASAGTISKTKNEFTISPFESGTLKTIEIEVVADTVASNLYKNSSRVGLTWASTEITDKDYGQEQEIKIYESDNTTFGSGLLIWDTEKKGPVTYKIDNIKLWTVGLYTKNANEILFGPANKLADGNYKNNTKDVMISGPYFYNNFGDWYDTKDLTNLTYSYTPYNLKNAESNGKNVIFVVRENTGSGYMYSKVLIKRSTTGFLHGTAPNRNLLLAVSYQKGTNVPYAKTK